MLPSCRVIFPHPPHNFVMRLVLGKFVLCINNWINKKNNFLNFIYSLQIKSNLKRRLSTFTVSDYLFNERMNEWTDQDRPMVL